MKLMTVKETARLLRVSNWRCYEMVNEGTLPSVRFGRAIRIDEAALQEFIRRGGAPLPDRDEGPQPAA